MTEPRKGYLRFKCRSCGALIKETSPNVLLTMRRIVADKADVGGAIGLHENCDENRAGLTDLIGCTFDDEV